MTRLSMLLLAALISGHAQASCRPNLKPTVIAQGGSWTALTSDQWMFLRGVSAMAPMTPSGLPVGDNAAMVQQPGSDFAIIIFLDGDMACEQMMAPAELVEMIMAVGKGEIRHQGEGL